MANDFRDSKGGARPGMSADEAAKRLRTREQNLGEQGSSDENSAIGWTEEQSGETLQEQRQSGAAASEQGEPQAGTLWLDAARLSRMGLGRLDLASAAGIAVTQDLTLAEGGRLQLVAPDVDIAATVTAHGGTVEATNVFDQDQRWGTPDTLLDADGGARIRLREGAVLDLRGLRADAAQDAASANRRGWIDGGEARLAATGGRRIRGFSPTAPPPRCPTSPFPASTSSTATLN